MNPLENPLNYIDDDQVAEARSAVEEALSEYRSSTGRSKKLDNPAKSIVRQMGREDDIYSSMCKTLYTVGIVDDLSLNIDLMNSRLEDND